MNISGITKMNLEFAVINETSGGRLLSVENRPPVSTKPANCNVEYVKLVIDPEQDLDFEIKRRFGDVEYNIRRVLHYEKNFGKSRFGGLINIMEPRDVYEIEIWEE